MDGYELVRRIRRISHCAKIPIVALTGRPIAQDEEQARAAGCSACLSKPFNLQLFADVIRRLRLSG
ncbi:response regulator [Caballeronia sp. AZ7_KS35]|uniref:response regulator n=1 Tax=Caballeronia sp. AZ7_KS35 TaxID=2921762 RepID=UPI002028426A|nr:response regulator [Caballeronia sp. AZ7_KS35]